MNLTQGTCCLRPSISCFTQLNTARYTSSSDGTLRLSLEIRSRTWVNKTGVVNNELSNFTSKLPDQTLSSRKVNGLAHAQHSCRRTNQLLCFVHRLKKNQTNRIQWERMTAPYRTKPVYGPDVQHCNRLNLMVLGFCFFTSAAVWVAAGRAPRSTRRCWGWLGPELPSRRPDQGEERRQLIKSLLALPHPAVFCLQERHSSSR